MTTTALPPAALAPRPGLFRRAEAWLDSKGRGAWIAAMVLGFIVFWPIGLAFVAYITWTNRWSKTMFGQSCRARRHGDDAARSFARDWNRPAFRATGNAAFDAYKADTLKRLEDEQEAFETFLQRLRQAKDKSEFDSFMDDRARRNREADAEAEAPVAEGTDSVARKGEY